MQGDPGKAKSNSSGVSDASGRMYPVAPHSATTTSPCGSAAWTGLRTPAEPLPNGPTDIPAHQLELPRDTLGAPRAAPLQVPSLCHLCQL